MPRSFDVLTESPSSVEEVYAAFGDEDYWRARYAAFDSGTALDALTVDADGTVTVFATQRLARRLLPGLVAKLIPGDLQILHSEAWKAVGNRYVRGQVSISAPAGLGSGRAEAWLAPMDPPGNGSRLRFTATVEVNAPLVGGKIENYVGSQLAENIPAIQRFTTTWIAEHV
jgi:hypothetical protein